MMKTQSDLANACKYWAVEQTWQTVPSLITKASYCSAYL